MYSYFFSKKGFTLLEMLVVLVLMGLIMTLLLEGATYTLFLRSRFLEQLNDSQKGALQEYWFRSTTTALITDYHDGEHVFQGNEREFSGLTLAALDMAAGIPTPFGWQLQYSNGRTTLRYQNQQGQYWDIASWAGQVGHFQYQTPKGQWRKRWVSELRADKPQIPHLILFQGQRRQSPITWLIKLTENKSIRYDFRLYERE